MKTKIKHLLGILLILYILPLNAQLVLPDVTEGEYFFDVDPGYGLANSISFNQGSSLNLNELFILNGLTNGHHLFGVRFKDADDNWGMTYTHSFAVDNSSMLNTLSDITSIEYFFDTDSGYSIQASISFTPDSILNLNNIFNLDSLGNGIHFLGIRAKDANNNWSQTYLHGFNVDNYSIVNELSDITEFEYFFNIEPGMGNASIVTLAADTLWDFSHTFVLDTLPLGSNFLGIRAKNEHEQYGHTYIHSFTKLEPPALFNLTGGGSYCEGATGLSAMLDDSETGVSYILFKDGVEIDTLTGTDTNLVWNNLIAGTYTVMAYFNNAPHIFELMNDSVVIVENPLPVLSCPADFGVCINVDSLELLTALPTGGTYTGTGVGDGFFLPSQLAAGDYDITYTFQDSNNCVNTCTFTISVDSLPILSCLTDIDVCNEVDSIQLSGGLPTGGTYSGTAVNNGYLYPAQLMPGDYNITYTYLDSNACANSCIFVVTIIGTPAISCSSDTLMCADADSVLLSGGLPAGGTFSGVGVNNNYFNPAVALPGNHIITYTVTDTNLCSNTCSFTISVLDLPSVSISGLNTFYCVYNQPVSITGTPAGGTFSGQGVSGNTFMPATAGLGFWDVVYSYTDTNGCHNADTIHVEVDACAGISNNDLLQISLYPNPTTGLFYIDMGSLCKAGQIKITDVVGQLIFEENIENKQYLKLNLDAAKGVYFVQIISDKEQRLIKLLKE